MNALDSAIDAAEGSANLARAVDVSIQTVSNWKARGRVSVNKVLEVERATGISRHDLRPDIFGPAPTKEAA